MASQDRLHRLLRLVSVLQSGPTYNAAQLARECEVSRRTIFRDIRILQESGIPIRFDKRRQGYSIRMSVLIPPTEFTLDEALSMSLLCSTLSSEAKGVPFQGSARLAAIKFLSALPGRLRELVGALSENIDLQIPPRNPHLESDVVYTELTELIRVRKCVRIKYRSLMPDEPNLYTTLLSPYRLVFRRHAWYVIGRSSRHRSVRTFHLGRIRGLEPVDSTFRIPERFSLDRYFGNAWNLIRERNQRHEVVVRFQPMVAQNVAEVQWHKTQRLVWNDDGTLDFHAIVDGLREIQWWILGYGDQAEVLQPQALRDAILYRVEAMQTIYRRSEQKSPRSRKSRSGNQRRSKKR